MYCLHNTCIVLSVLGPDMNVLTMAITDNVNDTEINAISSHQDNTYRSQNFSSIDAYVNLILDKICGDTPTPKDILPTPAPPTPAPPTPAPPTPVPPTPPPMPTTSAPRDYCE